MSSSVDNRHHSRPSERYGGEAVIACDNLVKIYKVEDIEAIALQGLDLIVEQGEFIAIIGASGSGKSTLLNILAGLEIPSAGEARVGGFDLLKMNIRERTRFRRETVGFVWQQTSRNLLPYLSALENVQLPMTLGRRSAKASRIAAMHLLGQVGLGDRLNHRPTELSGGEQQRVAIAIALANEPRVIFADEPTGELDSASADQVIEIFRRVNEENGVTIVVVTHDSGLANQVNRTVAIRDGRTSSETVRRTEVGTAGRYEVFAEEFTVLDRAGRLQLPREYIDALELKRRVKLTLDPDQVNVRRDDSNTSGGPDD